MMNDLLEQVPPLPITLIEYMPPKLISNEDDEEGDEEIQHVLCAMIRVTEADEKKETKAMSEQGPLKTNRTDLRLPPLDEEEFDIKIWYKGRKAYRLRPFKAPEYSKQDIEIVPGSDSENFPPASEGIQGQNPPSPALDNQADVTSPPLNEGEECIPTWYMGRKAHKRHSVRELDYEKINFEMIPGVG